MFRLIASVLVLVAVGSAAISPSTQVNLHQLQQYLHYLENWSKESGENISYSVDHASEDTYDYIIVGSGAAGSVLANRLSNNSNIKVLLLEAGGPPILLSDVPFIAPFQHFTRENWGYRMEKQDNFCLGLVDELMPCPRGRVLGGSTVTNFMLYVRGNRFDYDRWQEMGNPGWSYDDVLPFFKKSEAASLEGADPGYHNENGLLSVENPPFRSESADAFVAACQEVGYEKVDYNGPNQLGVSYVQATIRGGKRCSAEKAFIRPVKFRSNLNIQLNSRVTKILIDPVTKTAYGVEYIRNQKTYTAKATREVILSAGSINSPQILMLSGIGPQDHLTNLTIPVLQNLPVGKKLYDHPAFLGLVFTVNKPIVINIFETFSLGSILNYSVFGKGSLTSTAAVEAFAFFKTNVTTHTENYPDIEMFFAGGGLHSDFGILFRNMFGVSSKVYDAIWKPIESKYAWSIYPVLLHPKSHGFLKLKSKNPVDAPLIYGNYFTDPDNGDLETVIAAIREVQRIAKAPIFQQYGTEQVETKVPGCEQYNFDSDAYWECAIRHITISLYHPTTTCKMGPVDDPEAVVDHKLRVYGIKNLRVADASVIPTTISGHISAAASMIGEKAAYEILTDYAKS